MTDTIARGSKYVSAIRGLNFEGICRHDPAAIEALHSVLALLSDGDAKEEGLEAAGSSAVEKGVKADRDDRAEQVARQANMLGALKSEGFDTRIGKVYNSLVSDRVMEFRKVPHRQGLPSFDLVIAPDFSPSAGLHAIFITPTEVYSALAASPIEQNAWKVLKQKEYRSEEEMIDIVTMLSAGFDLP